MNLNKNKSAIMIHKGSLNTKQSSIVENGNLKKIKIYKKFPIANVYKYLGVWLDKKLIFKDQLEYVKEKIKRGTKIINILKWKKMDIWHKFYAWNTYITPHFRYGALIFLTLDENMLISTDNASCRALKVLYNKTVKILFDLPSNSPHALIDKFLG